MTARSLTLTDFLLARIAEDERDLDLIGEKRNDRRARWLAECAAKREVLRIAGGMGGHYEPNAARLAPGIFRALALPYSDHPDCRDEWRP